MPYKLYTEEFVNGGGLATLEQLKRVPDFKDFGQLFKNLVDWDCQVGNKFDMIKAIQTGFVHVALPVTLTKTMPVDYV